MSARTPIVWQVVRDGFDVSFRCEVPGGAVGFRGSDDVIYWVSKDPALRVWRVEDNCGACYGAYSNNESARAAVERMIGL